MEAVLEKLRKWVGMQSQPVLIAKIVGPVTLICTLMTYRGWLKEEQATWIVATGLPAAIGALYWLLAQTSGAVADRAVAQAPQATMEKIVDLKPQAAVNAVVAAAPQQTMNKLAKEEIQIVMDTTLKLDGVEAIIAAPEYAHANKNENVISPEQALERLSNPGVGP